MQAGVGRKCEARLRSKRRQMLATRGLTDADNAGRNGETATMYDYRPQRKASGSGRRTILTRPWRVSGRIDGDGWRGVS